MRRILFVGCGGSGGATLSYMIDELQGLLAPRADRLAAENIDGLPACWEFVQIDVPSVNDSAPKGLPAVGMPDSKGQVFGTYVSTGHNQKSYEVVDSVVASALGPKGVHEMGGWAPREPKNVGVAITGGAGQFRALGRVITLSQNRTVFQVLKDAWGRLQDTPARYAVPAMARAFPGFGAPGQGTAPDDASPLVLVISSMSGGAGASMVLDVCRTLVQVQGVQPAMVGVFMYAPDVFDSLKSENRQGVRANALAMLGEIVAAQNGSSLPHDTAMLTALKLDHGATGVAPFGPVFPVGRQIGTDGAILADEQQDIYRALGRGLAALITSGTALNDLAQYDMVNQTPIPFNGDYFGWGLTSEATATAGWKSFGYASLSMGRDRYQHYASQRLARTALDRLVEGHLEPGTHLNPDVQLGNLVNSMLDPYLQRLGLPGTREPARQWLAQRAIPMATYQAEADQIFTGMIAQQAQLGPSSTPGAIRNIMGHLAVGLTGQVAARAEERAYALARAWHETRLFQSTVGVFEEAAARFGLAFARGLAAAVQTRLEGLVGELNRSPGADQNIFAEPAEVSQILSSAREKDQLSNAQQIMQQYIDQVRGRLRGLLFAKAVPYFSRGLQAYATEVLGPLSQACGTQLRILEEARRAKSTGAGLANWATDSYADWPTDQDDSTGPAGRWDQAVTEVLVTPAEEFPPQYRFDLANSVRGWDGAPKSDLAPSARVAQGLWDTAGQGEDSPAQGPVTSDSRLIQVAKFWHPSAFPHDDRGTPVVAQPAAFLLHANPSDLRQRALAFVCRRQFSFDRFASLTLRDYLAVADDPARAGELAPGREDRLATLFQQALGNARPLAGVDLETARATVPKATLQLEYKFSALPFAQTALEQVLRNRLSQPAAGVSQQTLTSFNSALTDTDTNRVSIFGSYERLAPLAYVSLL
ncbi:MAG: tubulin-like doman-containing protein, partial [Bifidobacteriaceae bacterium]|nr:tubulin-like doman-containing protein [Bifidobacteriaceae bacterium]